MVRHGRLWCGASRLGAVRSGGAWSGKIRCGLVRLGWVRYGTVRSGGVCFGEVRSGLVGSGLVWRGMVWYGPTKEVLMAKRRYMAVFEVVAEDYIDMDHAAFKRRAVEFIHQVIAKGMTGNEYENDPYANASHFSVRLDGKPQPMLEARP